jgi:cell division protein FtsB
MFDFHEKRKIRSWLYSKVTIALLFVCAVVLGFSVVGRFSVEREMAAKREKQEAELMDLKARAAALEAKVDHLKQSRGVEEELRNRFDVAKEGEKVVVLVGEEQAAGDLEALKIPPGEEHADKPLWDFFKFWER